MAFYVYLYLSTVNVLITVNANAKLKNFNEERTGQLEEKHMFLPKVRQKNGEKNLFVLRRGRDNGKEKTYLQKVILIQKKSQYSGCHTEEPQKY